MIINSRRNQRGSMIAMSAAFLFGILALGLGIISLMGLFGGANELQSAVDSGNLNVAGKALDYPYVLIDDKSSELRKQFLPLSNNGKICLRNINKVMAFELITQVNLRSMQIKGISTPEAEANVKKLSDEAEKIAAELAQKLKDQSYFKSNFEDLANKNSLRMLPCCSQNTVILKEHKVSYVNRGEASNVSFSYDEVPENVKSMFQQNESQWFKKIGSRLYFRGYTDGIKILDREIHFVPLYEGSDDPLSSAMRSLPHLISGKDFSKESSPAEGSTPFSWDSAVPNAFLNTASVPISDAKEQALILSSCAVANDRKVSSLAPQLYIKINNPRGYNPENTMPSNDSIFNAELMSGIYLLEDASGVIGFSTDQSAQEALIAYNKDPINAPKPKIMDDDSNPIFFDRSGSPVSDLSSLSTASKLGSVCTCTNTLPSPGSEPEKNCSSSLGAFFNAYPHIGGDLPTGDNHSDLLAVEEARFKLFQVMAAAHKKWEALAAQGLTPQQANVKGVYPSISTVLPCYSGLRKFDGKSIQSTLNTKSMIFSQAGTVDDYLKQIALATKAPSFSSAQADIAGEVLISSSFDRTGNTDQKVQEKIDRTLSEVLEAVKQMAPEMTMDELKKLFADSSKTLQLGSSAYIYKDGDSGKVLLSLSAPSWLAESGESAKADGKVRIIESDTYHLLDCVVNAPGDNAHDVLFYVNPKWNSTALAKDQLLWTSSTGSNKLLGILEFRNFCYNTNNQSAEFYQPN
ncbi:MAG: hypothetical protein K2X27_02180 [Candidatus Obscuribacterales bacterium]|nr:hypothetical protein [Candidatus Obscuribacterales bacterium]